MENLRGCLFKYLTKIYNKEKLDEKSESDGFYSDEEIKNELNEKIDEKIGNEAEKKIQKNEKIEKKSEKVEKVEGKIEELTEEELKKLLKKKNLFEILTSNEEKSEKKFFNFPEKDLINDFPVKK
jgi:hypothetical protein